MSKTEQDAILMYDIRKDQRMSGHELSLLEGLQRNDEGLLYEINRLKRRLRDLEAKDVT